MQAIIKLQDQTGQRENAEEVYKLLTAVQYTTSVLGIVSMYHRELRAGYPRMPSYWLPAYLIRYSRDIRYFLCDKDKCLNIRREVIRNGPTSELMDVLRMGKGAPKVALA